MLPLLNTSQDASYISNSPEIKTPNPIQIAIPKEKPTNLNEIVKIKIQSSSLIGIPQMNQLNALAVNVDK